MARITSAAELKEALNRLCPEEAWGDKADVERMFDNGLTSLKYIATAEPNLLQSYGVPAFQAGYLRKRAQAAAAGTVVFVVKSECDEYELPLKITDEGILLENVEKNLEMHKPPLRPKSINNMPISLRRDKTLAIDLYDGQRLEMEAEILPDPPRGRAQMARFMARLALASATLAAVYYMVNIGLTLLKE